MNGVWIVTLHYDHEGDEILNVFSDNMELSKIKEFVITTHYRKHNTYGEPEWSEDNIVDLTRVSQLEISFMTFDDAELSND